MASLLLRRRLFQQTRSLITFSRTLRPIQHRLYSQANESSEPKEKPSTDNTSLRHIDDHFERVPHENRSKASFLEAIELFRKKSRNERGHVEFIHSALKHMKDYNLHKDLEVYKALIAVFPKGPLLPTNVWQRMFLHYPHQQNCCIKILDEMEWNMVYLDQEVLDLVKERFGAWAFATKKVRRMMFWLPRLRYTNKYLDRTLQEQRHTELSFAQLAKMGLEQMSRDKGATITYSKVTDENSLIVSSQSPLQRKLIAQMDPAKSCFYVDGPFLVYVAENKLQYFTFTTDPGPDSERLLDKFIDHAEIEDLRAKKLYNGPFEDAPESGTVHEQIDQTILALGALETINENSAFAWISHLQKQCPVIKKSTVILRINNEKQKAEYNPNRVKKPQPSMKAWLPVNR